MNAREAIEYLAVYANYATDGDIRLPDDRIMHVSDFCAEVVAARQSVHRTGEQSTAAFNNSDLHGDDREDSNPLFFTRR